MVHRMTKAFMCEIDFDCRGSVHIPKQHAVITTGEIKFTLNHNKRKEAILQCGTRLQILQKICEVLMDCTTFTLMARIFYKRTSTTKKMDLIQDISRGHEESPFSIYEFVV